MNTLLVGGSFDNSGGKPSELVLKIHSEIKQIPEVSDIRCINGGQEKHINMLIELSKLYDTIIWMVDANCDLRNISKYRKLILFIDNSNDKYTYSELRDMIELNKLSLLVEFKKLKNGLNNFVIFGNQSNIWYDGSSIKDCITCSLERIE